MKDRRSRETKKCAENVKEMRMDGIQTRKLLMKYLFHSLFLHNSEKTYSICIDKK